MSMRGSASNNVDVGIFEHHRMPTGTCATFPFMHLPKELRLHIYTYLSSTMLKPIDCVSPNRLGYWPVTICLPTLLVCRSIHNEAMDLFNDRQPAAVLCRANQQQKYCALQVALQRGCEIDRAWVETDACGGHNLRISPAAIEAALQTFLERVPYSKRRSLTTLPLRHRDLRHFFAQNIIRLRRNPQIHLTLYVETRPYKRFYNWYGTETSARAVAWYTRDSGEVWLLRCNLLNLIANGETQVTTKMTVTGWERDDAFKKIKHWLGEGVYNCSKDVDFVPLKTSGFNKLLEGAVLDKKY